MLRMFRYVADVDHSLAAKPLPPDVIWIDLLNPTREEEAFVEQRIAIRMPSIEMLSEIELSSRLAVEGDVIYLSVPTVAQGDTQDAYLSPAGFILTRSVLVTVRFSPLSTFDVVAAKVQADKNLQSAAAVFTALLEAIVDRAADVLERLGGELGKVSKSVFRGDPSKPRNIVRSNNALRRALLAVGTTGDRLALARDALLGIDRSHPLSLDCVRSGLFRSSSLGLPRSSKISRP